MFSDRIFIAIIFSIIITFSGNLTAQDSTKTNDNDNGWEWSWDSNEFEQWVHFGKKLPTISLQYGLTDANRNDISAEFTNPNLLEMQIGHTSRRLSHYADYLIKFTSRYFHLGYLSSKLAGSSDNPDELRTKSWRFGFGRSGGYGYKIGDAAVIPYSTYSFDWTRVDFENTSSLQSDNNIIQRYDESFRFGSSSEGGISFIASSLITIQAGYQRSIVFERHLFWKWAGSALIEAAAQGLVDSFIKEIFRSSPAAGPVVYFLLKNALSYGIYELRQEKMNWPFPSAPSLSFDSFKFGVTFTF